PRSVVRAAIPRHLRGPSPHADLGAEVVQSTTASSWAPRSRRAPRRREAEHAARRGLRRSPIEALTAGETGPEIGYGSGPISSPPGARAPPRCPNGEPSLP